MKPFHIIFAIFSSSAFANVEIYDSLSHQIILNVSAQCRVASDTLSIYSNERVDIIRTQAELEYKDITVIKDTEGYTYRYSEQTIFGANPYKTVNHYISCPDSLGY